MTQRPRILSVGQCAFDHARIADHLARALDAQVARADTAAEALAALRAGAFDLVLVNRVGDRDGAPGLDLIRTLKGDPDLATVPAMLVSNYPDAHEQAVALGALPGFGKAELGTGRDLAALRRAFADSP
jgi:two-component system, chemotaxis family, chemotaxis protein CheY